MPVSSGSISRAFPSTTLNTPAGIPARSASSASARAVRGVCSAGFDHHGAAGRQGLRGLPRDHRRGEIPRRNRRTDTDWFLENHDPPRGFGRGHHVAAHALGFFREPFDKRRRVGHFALGFREGLTLLHDDQTRQIVRMLDHQVEPPPQQFGSLFGRKPSPGGPCCMRGPHRFGNLGAAQQRQFCEAGSGGRVVKMIGSAFAICPPDAIHIGGRLLQTCVSEFRAHVYFLQSHFDTGRMV